MWALLAVVEEAAGWWMGLPSLQAIDRAQGAQIWMTSEATDMRCGFDRLAERMRAVIGETRKAAVCLC